MDFEYTTQYFWLLYLDLNSAKFSGLAARGHVKSNVLGAVVRFQIFASMLIPSAQNQVYLHRQNISNGHERHLSNNNRTIRIRSCYLGSSQVDSLMVPILSSIHVPYMYCFSQLKSPQVSASVSVYVLLVIEHLFFEFSTTEPRRAAKISISLA